VCPHYLYFLEVIAMKVFKLSFVVLVLLIAGSAEAVKLTIYDDGRSCPAGCDAHVVFHPTLNGTQTAHKPGSTAPDYQKCERSSNCEICFDQTLHSCMSVMYRGSGPGRDTFDLTPAFYEEWCDKEGIPQQLQDKCTELNRTAFKLVGRINCISQSGHPLCTDLINTAREAKNTDTPLYEECLRDGQSNFNRTRPDELKRIYHCSYEFLSNGGPNSRGMKWHKLLPGACRADTYVGRNGLDCCSGSPFVDAALGIECQHFYPKP
jgi:hypothetical protein